MWSKIIDPRISRTWLLRPCTGCKLRSAEAYYSHCVHGPPSTASSGWVTDVKAGHSPRGGGGGRWRRRDRWCLTETIVEVSYSEPRERCGRAAFPRKMRDTIIVGDLFISDGRSGSHPANTVFEPSRLIKRISGRTGASPWFRRHTCGFSVAPLRNNNASCRYATTVRGPAPGMPSHNRMLSRDATRSAVQQLRLSTA